MRAETIEMWNTIEKRVAKFVQRSKVREEVDDVLAEIRMLFLAGDQGDDYGENQAVAFCEKYLYHNALQSLGIAPKSCKLGHYGDESATVPIFFTSIDDLLERGWEPADEASLVPFELGVLDERKLFMSSPLVPCEDKEMVRELERGVRIKDIAAAKGVDSTAITHRLKRHAAKFFKTVNTTPF